MPTVEMDLRLSLPSTGTAFGQLPPVPKGLRQGGAIASLPDEGPTPDLPLSTTDEYIRTIHFMSPAHFATVRQNVLANPPRTVFVYHAYRTPTELGTRAAQDYYGNSVFTFRDLIGLLSWYSALPARHRALVKDMRVVNLRVPRFPWHAGYMLWAQNNLIAARPQIARTESSIGADFATKVAYEIECAGLPMRCVLRMPATDAPRRRLVTPFICTPSLTFLPSSRV